MMDGAESRVPCSGDSVAGPQCRSVVCRLREGGTAGSQLVATGPWSGENDWDIR